MDRDQSHPRSTEDWFRGVQEALERGELQQARALVFHWLNSYAAVVHADASRSRLRCPELWTALADVVERTSDQYLLERFWQLLDPITPPPRETQAPLPLLGIPILNRGDLLQELLASLDHPVETLAIVDNSGGDPALQDQLDQLVKEGHPLIQHIAIARNFGNGGVATSWNQILLGFPSAGVALLANNDVRFSQGCLAQALQRINTTAPQLLPLLPEPACFSAFLITAKAWDQLGLFDPHFYPAYCEDLEFRDRLRSNPAMEWLEASDLQNCMAACNGQGSQTIGSDPALAAFNRSSFALNRLWYLSHRRLQHDPRGQWLRRWLAEWKD